ncbi:protein of unknown function [Cupriavidus neocaledonicus]|uniref:Uncharacterized protein n=1 Tax=Cupriavidus neocaledonicus TaxID=1040979 RepID=A0A375HCF9_9BURK|nr:hypothetical protein CBM2605_A310063 [Cupriavidus neocaledonicus]SPD48616.1 protein of unknown function [Cupriavidus neocaledonicus]
MVPAAGVVVGTPTAALRAVSIVGRGTGRIAALAWLPNLPCRWFAPSPACGRGAGVRAGASTKSDQSTPARTPPST